MTKLPVKPCLNALKSHVLQVLMPLHTSMISADRTAFGCVSISVGRKIKK